MIQATSIVVSSFLPDCKIEDVLKMLETIRTYGSFV